jgi:hypothetical protein
MCMGYSCVAMFGKMGLGVPCLGSSLPYGWGSALAWTHDPRHNIRIRMHIYVFWFPILLRAATTNIRQTVLTTTTRYLCSNLETILLKGFGLTSHIQLGFILLINLLLCDGGGAPRSKGFFTPDL